MNGSAKISQEIEAPTSCKGCGLKREEAMEQYGGYLILPTAIPSIVTYICPACGNMQANSNAYELTKTLIAKQQNEPRIIKPDNKVVQLTPRFK
jgi:hypothetical protein